jgi:hypothetical protein
MESRTGWILDDPSAIATVRAALRLWLKVVESSSTHPRHFPESIEEFEHAGPLTVKQVENLLAEGPEHCADHSVYVTTAEAADRTGLSKRTVQRKLNQMKIEPHSVHRNCKFYTYTDMSRAVGTLMKQALNRKERKVGRPIKLRWD